MPNPTQFQWVDPTTNTDGSTITTGEVTGYQIGVRLASGTPGQYLVTTQFVPGAASTTEVFSSLSAVLAPGDYAAAIQTVGPTNSVFSTETTFTIAAPVPNPPTGFTAA